MATSARHMMLVLVLSGLTMTDGIETVKIKMGILLSGNGWKTGNDSYPAVKVAVKDLEEYSKSWDRRKCPIYKCSSSAR